MFGWFLTAFFVGAAIGPIAFATIATSQNSVVLPLYLLIALHIVPMLAFVTLGRYSSVADLAAANGKVPDLENDISHSKEKDGLAHS